jgi:hypothetical protein
MNDVVSTAWNWQVQIVPVLLGFVIAEAPMWVRRLTKSFYVPVYAPFLLESLNKDLAIYYGEDFLGNATELDERALRRIKRHLVTIAFVSMLLSAVIQPLYYGATLAFILSAAQFTQFLIAMAVYRAIRCYWSYRDFGAHSIATRASQGLIALIYLMYVGAVTQLASNANRWAQPYALNRDWGGLFGALSELLFVKGAALGVAVAFASAFFSKLVADPDLRQDQLEKIRERYANLRSIPASSREISEGK